MSYLGNTPSETFHQATSQVFNGDGSTTAFTLEKRVNRAEEIEVFVNNIQQQPTVAYSANNNTLTFTEAPDSATGNIYVVYRMFAQQNTFNALHDFTDAVTMASTLAVTGETTLSTHLNLGDNDKIKLGASGDLEVYHDGSNSFIDDGGTGNLFLRGESQVIIGNMTGEQSAVFNDDGAVQLNHDNSLKLATSSTGVTVTGNIANASGDFTLDVDGDITLDADGQQIFLKNGGTHFGTLLTNATPQHFYIDSAISDGDLIFRGNDGGSNITALTLDMSNAGQASFNSGISASGELDISSSSSTSLISATASGSANLVMGTNFSGSATQGMPNQSGFINMRQSFPIVFGTAETERMRIHSGGHITAGTTSFGNHFFVYQAPTGGNAVTKIRNSSSNTSNQVCLLLSINERTDTNSAFLQGNNGFSNFYLFANGTHSFTSDENRKKNIETTRDGYLEDLAKLRVVKYNWKNDEDGADKELGLIAQEVEKVFPKLVMEDPQNASDTDETKFKMIKTSVLPMMLLKALQEANTKITALETENKTQATQIDDLISRVTALEGA